MQLPLTGREQHTAILGRLIPGSKKESFIPELSAPKAQVDGL